jgi:hypothetical protein
MKTEAIDVSIIIAALTAFLLRLSPDAGNPNVLMMTAQLVGEEELKDHRQEGMQYAKDRKRTGRGAFPPRGNALPWGKSQSFSTAGS